MSARKKNVRLLAGIFLVFSFCLSLSIMMADNMLFGNQAQKVVLQNAVKKSKEREGALKAFLDESQAHLKSIRNSAFFYAYMADHRKKEDLENLLLVYANSDPFILGIKYIGKKGNEKLGIARNPETGNPYVLSHDQLKNFSGKNYFTASQKKAPDEVWYSQILLNKENSAEEIPIEPTIKIILPVGWHNEFSGILLVDYSMKSIFDEFTNTPLYDMILCDDKGRLIFHYLQKKCKDNACILSVSKQHANLNQDFPADAETILANTLLKTETFVSRKLQLPITGGLNLVLQLNKDYAEQEKRRSEYEYVTISAIVYLLSIILTYIIIKLFSQKLLNIDKLNRLNDSLNQAVRVVKTQKNELETIFETAIEGICVLDLDLHYEFFNRNYLKIAGCSEKELSGSSLYDWLSEENKENAKRLFRQVLSNGEHGQFEREHITRSGKRKRLRSSVALMPDKQQFLMTTVDNTELYNAMLLIKEQAVTDELTGLHNRKAYQENITELIAQYKRYQTPFCLMMFDIDFFKSINDTYGHQTGDNVLVALASLVKGMIRESDLVFRVGGEEFIILFPHTKLEQAEFSAEKIRKSVQSDLRIIEEREITVSIGLVEMSASDTENLLYKRADEYLYQAKESGRNRVCTQDKQGC